MESVSNNTFSQTPLYQTGYHPFFNWFLRISNLYFSMQSKCHMEPNYKCRTCRRLFHHKENYNAHRSICERGKYSRELCGRKILEHPDASETTNVQIDQEQNQALINDLTMEIKVEETTIPMSSHDDHGQSVLNPFTKIDGASLEKNVVDDDIGCSSGQNRTHVKQSKIYEENYSSIQEGMNCTEEPKEKNINQAESGKSSTGSSGVNSALQSHHGSNRSKHPYMCNICDIGFSGYRQANYHKVRLFKFSILIYFLNTLLSIQLTRHTEAKFECPHCSKKYHDATKFKMHTSVCAGRKISCELCSQKFKCQSNLKQHMSRFHGSKRLLSNGIIEGTKTTNPEKSSTGGSSCTKCLYCEKEFSNEDSLPGHIEQCHVSFAKVVKARYHKLMLIDIYLYIFHM